jgi:hypothetical protein
MSVPVPNCIDLKFVLTPTPLPDSGSIRLYADLVTGKFKGVAPDGSNALPTAAPGGNGGDLQFNDGAGGFTNASAFNGADFRIGGFGGGLSGTFPGGITLTSSGNSAIRMQTTQSNADINLISGRDLNATIAGAIGLTATTFAGITANSVEIDCSNGTFVVNVGGDNLISMGVTTFSVGSDNGTCAIKIGTNAGDTLGFFNTAPIAKPTVTGAKAGNAALTSLLQKLAALGLIIDSTT